MQKFYIGDIVETKKPHPCGNKEWEITRLGADIKMKCTKCSRIVMLVRGDFEKRVKKVISSKGED